jgi:3',5'-cyclic AMP phosphodiesterase CpdA
MNQRSIGRITLLLVVTSVGFASRIHAEAFSFVQMCDTQLGMGGYEHDVETFELAVEQINALEPDFVVICGDLINDTDDDQAFIDFKRIRDGFDMPCYSAPGNHDVGNEPTLALLERYRKSIGEDYYAVEHKGYTFIIVNTQLWKAPVVDETAKQDAWLRDALEQAVEKNSPVFIAGHYPLFLTDPTEDEQYFNLPPETRAMLLRLFLSHKVVGILTGHTHRMIENTYEGMQLVTSGTTSRNFDDAPMGFRVWTIDGSPPFKNEYVAVEGAEDPVK